ncbi:MAG: hypothetical protein KC503_41805 [Myxococcales bacterium]|nr:hypothetical protein [Myxococcales bacterium]
MIAGRAALLPVLIALALASSGCSSIEVVRLQPDILHTPRGTEPLAGLQATCMGFYFFTLPIPEAHLDKVINDMLIKEAKKIGADKLVGLRFDVTPSHGIWFLTKLLWWRVATAWAIAVVAERNPAPLPPVHKKKQVPASQPASSQPAATKEPADKTTKKNKKQGKDGLDSVSGDLR